VNAVNVMCQYGGDVEDDSELPRVRHHRAGRRKSTKKPITQVYRRVFCWC